MNALERYQKRVSSTIGTNVKDYVKDQVRTNLDKFLDNSQYGMDVEIDNKIERIGIMTGSMTDTRDEVLVLSKPNILKMGTLFKWEDEFWVVVKRQARVIKESFYGTAFKCNVDLKWVNKNGELISQKAYAKGRGLSSILVENNYTDPPVLTRDIDTPITVITQRNLELEQDMRFLFNGQPYRVTFIDNLSIDGTTILGMYDDILQDGDDIENNVANYNNHYSIELNFENPIIGKINEPYEIKTTVLNNGTIADKKVIIDGPEGKVKIENNIVTPLVQDSIPMVAYLEQNDLIFTGFNIETGEEWNSEDNIFIIGSDNIIWNRSSKYKINIDKDVEFIVDWSKAQRVKHKEEIKNNEIEIFVEDKYSGEITLMAILENGEIITKKIEIISNEEV